jgi:hypothetical protein
MNELDNPTMAFLTMHSAWRVFDDLRLASTKVKRLSTRLSDPADLEELHLLALILKEKAYKFDHLISLSMSHISR